MIDLKFLIIVAIVYGLYYTHEKYRKPIYIYNTWQEDKENLIIARIILILMCVLSCLGGMLLMK